MVSWGQGVERSWFKVSAVCQVDEEWCVLVGFNCQVDTV